MKLIRWDRVAVKETATGNSICSSQSGETLLYAVNASRPFAETAALKKPIKVKLVNRHLAMVALLVVIIAFALTQVSQVSGTSATLPDASPKPTPKPITCLSGQHLVGNQCVSNPVVPPPPPTPSCPLGQHLVGQRCVPNTSVDPTPSPRWTPPQSNPDPPTANTYHWYRSTRQYSYSSSFPYRYVFYSAPYYYYVQDTVGNLQSQVQTLQDQVQASQSDRDQAIAQAQQLSSQVDSLNQQVNDLNTQLNNVNSQYTSQLSNLQSQATNLQNNNQALQANLDATRTQNNIMLVIVLLLGVCIVGLLIIKKKPNAPPNYPSRPTY